MNIRYLIDRQHFNSINKLPKALLFINSVPKKIEPGAIIELSIKGEPGQPTVGEAVYESLIPMQRSDGKWPTCGCYPFFEFYVRYILNDVKMADHIKNILNEFEYKFEKYKFGFILDFIFSEKDLENIRKYGEPIDTWKLTNKDAWEILRHREKSHDLQKECDQWLEKLGLYDEFGTTTIRYGVVIKNVQKYVTPIINANTIKNWCYVKKEL